MSFDVSATAAHEKTASYCQRLLPAVDFVAFILTPLTLVLYFLSSAEVAFSVPVTRLF